MSNKKDLDYAREIGRKLSLFRSYFGLTQSDIANSLGCTQKYISLCESGKNLLSTRYLLKFHQFYKVPLAYFEPQNGIGNLDLYFKDANVESEVLFAAYQ